MVRDCFASLAMTEFVLMCPVKFKTVNWGSTEQGSLKKQSQFTPKGVERGPGDDCFRDIMVFEKEIWYKAYVTGSTEIFRCLRRNL